MKIANFIEIESYMGLLNDNIHGFEYWNYSRSSIWDYLFAKKHNLGKFHTRKEGYLAEIQNVLCIVTNILFHGFIPQKTHKILVMNHERRVRDGDVYKCIYTEHITDLFPDSFVLERAYQRRHLKPIETKNIVYTDWLDVLAIMFSFFAKCVMPWSYFHVRKEVYSKISDAINQLEKIYEIDISKKEVVNLIVKKYYLYKCKKFFFRKILQRIKPQIIIQVVSYNIDCMILNELSKELEIATFEMQHGVNDSEYIDYNFEKRCVIKQFPDNLCTFGEYWNTSAKYPLNVNLIEIGFYYLEKRLKECPPRRDEKWLFVSSGGGLGKKLYQIALSFIELMPKERVIYKLHPGEYATWKSMYPDLLDRENVEVIDTLDKDIYSCLSHSKAIVGVGSTTLYESTVYKIPIFIVEDVAVCHSEPLIKYGYAKMIKDAYDLLDYEKFEIPQNSETQSFFALGAEENIKKVIKKSLMNERE